MEPKEINGTEYLSEMDPFLANKIARCLDEKNISIIQNIINYKGARFAIFFAERARNI